MRMAGVRAAGLAALAVATLLAACQATEPGAESSGQPEAAAVPNPAPAPAPAPGSGEPPPEAAAASAALPPPEVPGASAPKPTDNPAPHVYMALQPDGPGLPVSVIFAIDAARDGTPSDDPAIRLTPDNGLCNPQEMRHYAFPPEAAHPVVTEADQARGLTAANLPEFMAVAVTDRMLAEGLAEDREETRALNICTRKLWERLVLGETQATLAAGQ
jgi:hypothetical protein